MSIIKNSLLGRYASLESDRAAEEPELPAAEEGVDESGNQLDAEALPESELMAANDQSDEVEEASDEMDELQETTESLESFLAAAQQAKKTGGWDQSTAGAIQLGLDATFRKIGLPGSTLMPSVESFGNTERERVDQTTAVENAITDALTKMWEAIKRAVNKVTVFMRKWFLKVFDGASRLKKRAEAISKKAQATNGTPKSPKVRSGVLGLIRIGKAAPTLSDVEKTYGVITATAKGLTEDRLTNGYAKSIGEVLSALEKAGEATEVKNDIKSVLAASEEMNKAVQDAAKAMAGRSAGKATTARWSAAPSPVQRTLVASPELLGGKTIEASMLTSDTFVDTEYENSLKCAAYVGLVRIADISESKVEIDESLEVPTLAPGDIVKMCDLVVAFCDVVIDYKQGFESYDGKNKEVLKKLDKLSSKSLDKLSGTPEVAKFVRASANTAAILIRNVGTSITTVIGYGANTSRGVLAYCATSLAQYKD